jgi:hypothetical protein
MRKILLFGVLVIILAGCSSPAPEPTAIPAASTAEPTSPSAPTQTSVSTESPVPSATIEPTLTALPEGILFRDDFNGDISVEWDIQNENPGKWTLTDDGWLQIVGEHNSLLGEEYQTNLFWHVLPEGDFVITTHLKTKPFENFHQSALFIYEDPENYIAINRGFCDVCSTGGGGFYMDYKISGVTGAYSSATDAEDVYLRLESKNDMITGYYAVQPDQWQRLGRFGNYFKFTRVGIGVSNVRAPDDLVGLFDYFEISKP